MAGKSKSIVKRVQPSAIAAKMVNLFRQYHVIRGGIERLNQEFIKATEEVLDVMENIPGGNTLKKHIIKLKKGETPMNAIHVELLPYNGLMHEDIIEDIELQGMDDSAVSEIEKQADIEPEKETPAETEDEAEELSNFSNSASLEDWNIGKKTDEEGEDSTAETSNEENLAETQEVSEPIIAAEETAVTAAEPAKEETPSNIAEEIESPLEKIEIPDFLTPAEDITTTEEASEITPEPVPEAAIPTPDFLTAVDMTEPAEISASTPAEPAAAPAAVPDFLTAVPDNPNPAPAAETLTSEPAPAAAPDFLVAPDAVVASPVSAEPALATEQIPAAPALEPALSESEKALEDALGNINLAELTITEEPSSPPSAQLEEEIAMACKAFTPDYKNLEDLKALLAAKGYSHAWRSELREKMVTAGRNDLLDQMSLIDYFDDAINVWDEAQQLLAKSKDEVATSEVAARMPDFEKYLSMFGEQGISLLNQIKNTWEVT